MSVNFCHFTSVVLVSLSVSETKDFDLQSKMEISDDSCKKCTKRTCVRGFCIVYRHSTRCSGVLGKHKQENSRWNAWMEITCAQPLIDNTDTNDKLRVHSTITFCTYSYIH